MLALFCYKTAMAKGASLEWALDLLVWNSVMVRWVNSYTGKVGRLAFTKRKTLEAAALLIRAFPSTPISPTDVNAMNLGTKSR